MYARKTKVSISDTQIAIERVLDKYGAHSFAYAKQPGLATVQFAMNDRQIRFNLPLPDSGDRKFWVTDTGRRRQSEEAAQEAWRQECRSRWRSLFLCIKAKLEAVESQITEFDDEFMSHTVMPDNRTFGEWAKPEIHKALASGDMPMMITHEREENGS